MRAKLVKIGNSRGIRLPKSVIEEAGLGDEVELRVRKGEIVIARVKAVREGWAEAALHMAKHEAYEDDDDFEDHLPEEDWSDFWVKVDK
ncbi:MAG: AbrB/MazE/SpoVT family DNA-binding domain-containing protein [Gemmatimonadota bacterium]|nr:AbrB/MazE/SpoVT family DNA-binding domain-containing protein [Gemmatimonadota bacterium]